MSWFPTNWDTWSSHPPAHGVGQAGKRERDRCEEPDHLVDSDWNFWGSPRTAAYYDRRHGRGSFFQWKQNFEQRLNQTLAIEDGPLMNISDHDRAALFKSQWEAFEADYAMLHPELTEENDDYVPWHDDSEQQNDPSGPEEDMSKPPTPGSKKRPAESQLVGEASSKRAKGDVSSSKDETLASSGPLQQQSSTSTSSTNKSSTSMRSTSALHSQNDRGNAIDLQDPAVLADIPESDGVTAGMFSQAEWNQIRTTFQQHKGPGSQVLLQIMGKYDAKAVQSTRGQQNVRHGGAECLASNKASEGAHLTFGDWLRLFSTSTTDAAWMTDSLLDVDISSQQSHFKEGAYFWAPCLVAKFNSALSDAETANRQLLATMASSNAIDWPASHMPANATSLHFLWNPDGNHWIAVEAVPNFTTKQGDINVYDSYFSRGKKRTVERARAILPNILGFISNRPDLRQTWNQVAKWTVCFFNCPQQDPADTYTCGLLAADNCLRRLLGDYIGPQNLLGMSVTDYAKDLRLAMQKRLLKLFFGEDISPDQLLSGNSGIRDASKVKSRVEHVGKVQSRAMGDRGRLEEWKNVLRRHKSTVFTAPLSELVDSFEYRASTAATEANEFARAQNEKVAPETMSTPCEMPNYMSSLDMSSPTRGLAGLRLDDVLSVLPNGAMRTSWATDSLLDFLVLATMQDGTARRNHAYIAPIDDVHRFRGAGAADGKTSLQRAMQEATSFDPSRHDPATYFPASAMPNNARTLSLIWNLDGNHWVHVFMEVNAEKTIGNISVHDSIFRPAMVVPPSILEEAPLLAKLVSMRPSLGWHTVEWRQPRLVACPRQQNDSDCGFFSWYFAKQTALHGVDRVAEESETAPELGLQLRLNVLTAIYRSILRKDIGAVSAAKWLTARPPAAGDNRKGSGAKNNTRQTTGGKTAAAKTAAAKTAAAKGPAAAKTAKKSAGSRPDGKSTDSANGSSAADSSNTRSSHDAGVGFTEDADFDVDDDVEDELAAKAAWTGNNWKIDVRQLLCNIMLNAPDRTFPETELCDSVCREAQTLATERGFDITDELEILCNRTKYMLTASPETFVRSSADIDPALLENGEEPEYFLDLRPGHCVNTDTQNALLEKPLDVAVNARDQRHFKLIVSIVRSSGKLRTTDQFAQLADRCREQIKAYWSMYVPHDGLPEETKTWPSSPAENCCSWTGYSYSGSSTDVLLHPEAEGQGGMAGKATRDMLQEINDQAAAVGQFADVALLQGGPDGGSSNNRTWKYLRDQYPSIRFRVVMVVHWTWNNADFEMDSAGNGWASFDVNLLADLYEGEQQDQAVPGVETHTRFLTACQLVDHHKIDHRVGWKMRQSLGLHLTQHHLVASALTRAGRKTFDLYKETPGHIAQVAVDITRWHDLLRCPDCSLTVTSTTNMRQHCRYYCPKSKERCCDICQRTFAQIDFPAHRSDCLKEAHRAAGSPHQGQVGAHSEVKEAHDLLRCPDCGSTFKNTSNLRVHCRYRCPKSKERCCNICHQVFAQIDFLDHWRDCRKEEGFKCDLCPETVTFGDRKNLDSHRLLKHGIRPPGAPRNICLHCGKEFRPRGLGMHESACRKQFRSGAA